MLLLCPCWPARQDGAGRGPNGRHILPSPGPLLSGADSSPAGGLLVPMEISAPCPPPTHGSPPQTPSLDFQGPPPPGQCRPGPSVFHYKHNTATAVNIDNNSKNDQHLWSVHFLYHITCDISPSSMHQLSSMYQLRSHGPRSAHVTDEHTEVRGEETCPKVTQLRSSRTGLPACAVWLQSPQ